MNRQALAAYVYNERARRASALTKGGGLPWYPNLLFQTGDILLWYDPSDLTTMFKDTAGTQPVTADGDSVALMLDKGQWGGKTLEQVLAAQPELVSNGTFDSDVAGWTNYNSSTLAWQSGGFARVTNTGGSNGGATISVATVPGKLHRYAVRFVATNGFSTRIVAQSAPTTGSLEATSAATGGRTDEISFVAAGSTTYLVVQVISGNSAAVFDFDLATVKEIPGYHRIQATGTSMPKYKTDGTLHWLLYDGTDDGHATGTITWGTDEVAVCAGVTKSSDDAAAPFIELSASSSANAGAFAIFAPYTNLGANFGFRGRGSASADAASAGFAAPTTNVLTGQGKISADLSTLRVDAAQVASSLSDQGSGNFGSYPLYFGRRAGTSLPFNGREYQTVIRSRLLSAAELSSLETFVAAKTGVIL